MKASIVIPIYNEEKYIKKCLESLLSQDCSFPYEIIVVDNGSSDQGPAIARTFDIKVVECFQKGVVKARKCGFETASGELILQADADTIYPVSWASQIIRDFTDHAEVVGIQGEVEYIASPFWIKPCHALRRLLNIFASKFLGKPLLCLAANFAFRAEALRRIGGYDESLAFFGDGQDILTRLSKLGRIAYDSRIRARTSSRRFRNGFLRFVFIEWMYQVIIGSFFTRIAHRFPPFFPAFPREEYHAVSSHNFTRAFPIGVGLVVATFGVLTWGYFYPESQIFGKTFDEVRSQEKVIALTFDDGPNEPYTSQILDILRSSNVKATFFVIGRNVEYYPDSTRRIVEEGHVLGNHSYAHKAFAEFDIPDYSELDRAQSAIFHIAGVKPHLFRPPFGRKTPWELEYVKHKGLVTVAWSVFGQDTHTVSSEYIASFVVAHAKPGEIILLHDGYETIHGGDRSKTVAALPAIIELLQKEGFTFVTVPELLHISPYLQ